MKLKFTLLVLFIGLITQAQVIANQPDDLVLCDDDDFAVFDLTQTFGQIIDGQDPFDLLIYFYETQQDADSNTNAIVNDIAYMNVSNPQTIYVRVEHVITSEYDTTNFQLIVLLNPEIGVGPFEMSLCDDFINGSAGDDEISTFDLTMNNDEITLGNTTLSVYYYETLADQNANIPINPDTAYQNTSSPQTLYVSVFNVEGCESKTFLTINIIPNPAPNPNPDALVVCDDDNDGFAEFNLHDADANIINGEPNVFVNYFGTEYHATIGDFSTILQTPYANDDPFNDNVWARVENDITGCFTIVQLFLEVNNIPDEPTDDFGDLTVYDDDGDGTAIFNLTVNSPFVLGVQDPLDFSPVTYFVSLTDAIVNVGAIANPSSFSSSGQTIWFRIENIATGCFRIGTFELIVDTTIGIDDVAFSDVSISPNPALDIIQIQSDNFSAETNVQVYNIQGQVVFSEVKNSATGNFTINVSDFASGMYFVQIQSEGKTVAKKLIKQ